MTTPDTTALVAELRDEADLPEPLEACPECGRWRWLSLGVATIQQQALRDLDKAFQNWWRNPIIYGRPTWRKKGENESFKVLCPSTRPRKIKRVSRRTGQVNVPKNSSF